MLQSQEVENPIYKIQRKQFLKKSSIEKDMLEGHLNPLIKRSRNAKERSVSSNKKDKTWPRYLDVAVQTNQNMDSLNHQISQLRREKQQLVKQLVLKESHFLQLKLKHIDLKQKYQSLPKNSSNTKHDNSYDFGDISNISVSHSVIPKNKKTMELSALKQRLQNIKIDKLLHNGDSSISKSKVLPSEV